MSSDLAELKANLAKYKKGKHGKGLDDIDIEQLDWVNDLHPQLFYLLYLFLGCKQQKS